MAVSSYNGVIKRFNSSTNEVKWYFSSLPKLLFHYEATLAYMFLNVEKCQNTSLYCGLVKLHGAETTLASRIIDKQHLTRDLFSNLFKNIFNHNLPQKVIAPLNNAEQIRDRVVHGKNVSDKEIRTAIVDIIIFAELYNNFVLGVAGFKPFGSLQGFKGRGKKCAMDAHTTRWFMKGMGFHIK